MGNWQSTTQDEKLTGKSTSQNIHYSFRIPFYTNDFEMKFNFSLNNIDFVFKIFLNIKESKYRYNCSAFGGIL
jgi:hypothetical protein